MLAKDNNGQEVKEHQNNIIALGFGEYLGKYGADSHFGKLTHLATEKLQEWLNIKVDGIVGPQTRKAVDQAKKQAGLKGTCNFDIGEFYCKDENRTQPPNGMSSELLLKLEVIRYQFGNKPVVINSGYRTVPYNRAVGGATNSQHLYGRAADIKIKGVSPAKIYDFVDKALFKNNGAKGYNTFVHIDTRGRRARW